MLVTIGILARSPEPQKVTSSQDDRLPTTFSATIATANNRTTYEIHFDISVLCIQLPVLCSETGPTACAASRSQPDPEPLCCRLRASGYAVAMGISKNHRRVSSRHAA